MRQRTDLWRAFLTSQRGRWVVAESNTCSIRVRFPSPCCSGCAPRCGRRTVPRPNGWSRSGSSTPCGCADAGETEDWAIDATDAVTAEVSAVLNITRGLAASHLRYAQALREHPADGWDGHSSPATSTNAPFAPWCTGPASSSTTTCWPKWTVASRWAFPAGEHSTRSSSPHRIDQIVASVDLDAVRRRKDRVADREVFVGDVDNGLAEIHATVLAPDAHATAERLTALAHTVCEKDPRSLARTPRRCVRGDGRRRGPDGVPLRVARLRCRVTDPRPARSSSTSSPSRPPSTAPAVPPPRCWATRG